MVEGRLRIYASKQEVKSDLAACKPTLFASCTASDCRRLGKVLSATRCSAAISVLRSAASSNSLRVSIPVVPCPPLSKPGYGDRVPNAAKKPLARRGRHLRSYSEPPPSSRIQSGTKAACTTQQDGTHGGGPSAAASAARGVQRQCPLSGDDRVNSDITEPCLDPPSSSRPDVPGTIRCPANWM
jgi:hypothetical protein